MRRFTTTFVRTLAIFTITALVGCDEQDIEDLEDIDAEDIDDDPATAALKRRVPRRRRRHG
jgi:hypothetical protein